EHKILGRRRFRARVLLAQVGDLHRVAVVNPAELTTRLGQAVAHAVDVAVVKTHGGEHEVARFADRLRPANRCVAHAVPAHATPPVVVISSVANAATDARFSWKCGAAASSPSLVRNGSPPSSGSRAGEPVIADL